MPVITVSGQKGGCGKSTLCANVAGELARRGKKVIALDVDPQQSLSFWAAMGKEAEVLPRIVRQAEADDYKEFKFTVNEAAQEAEYVFVDTPPGLADRALISAVLSDMILMPCLPSPPDVMSLKRGIATMKKAEADISIVPWQVRNRTLVTGQMMTMLEKLGIPLAPGTSSRAVYFQSVFSGQIVTEYDPKSPAAEEINRLTDWVLAAEMN